MSAAPDVITLSRTIASHDESLRAVGDATVEVKIVVDRHTIELSKIRRTLKRHDRSFLQIHHRMDRVEVRMDALEVRLDRVEVRLDRLEIRLDRLEARLEAGLDRLEVRMADVEGMLVEVLRRLPDPGPR